MTKPTLLQTLLNKPSQTYSFPHQKEYHSTRKHMVRIAADPAPPTRTNHPNQPPRTNHPPEPDDDDPFHPDRYASFQKIQPAIPRPAPLPSPPLPPLPPPPPPPSAFANKYHAIDNDDTDDDDDDLEVFYTPNQSPRTSFASSMLVVSPPPPPPNPNPNPPLAPRSQAPPARSNSPARMATRQPLSAAAASTPSGTVTMLSHEQPKSRLQPHQLHPSSSPPPPSASASAPLPSSHPPSNPQPRAVPSTRTRTNAASTASSLDSTSLDGHSLFSDMLSDVSTRLTSPIQSDSSHTKRKQKAPVKRKDYAYTDEDWAKDVRWLVPSKEETSKSTITPLHLPGRKKSTSKSSKQQQQQPSYFTASHGMPMPNGHPKPIKGHNQSIMMSMTALLEEEEEGELSSPPSSYHSPARTPQPSISKGYAPLPKSSVLLAGPSRLRVSSSPSSSNPELVPSPTRTAKPAKPPMKRRRSRSLDHPPPSLSSSRTSATAKSYKAELQVLPKPSGELPSSGTQGYTSLVLPRAMPMRSATAPLPLPNLGAGLGDGRIDLTKAGLAQTTMASVEVVRGLGESVKKGGGLMRVFSRRRATISNPPGKGRNGSVNLTPDVKGKGKAREGETILGFTSHRPPPTQVPSGSVVVQVWAVGVDGVDGRLVGVRVDPVSSQTPPPESAPKEQNADRPKPKRTLSLRSTLGRSASTKSAPSGASPSSTSPPELKKAEVGFIPGRSFVGRVLECGWDVREEVVRRGEWVVGLLDVRKSGALTEFITVDRHRIHRVPHPRMDPAPTLPNVPPPVSRPTLAIHTPGSTPTLKLAPQALTLEELALLPLCGVPAYRAVRTFMFAFSSVREEGGSVSGSGSLPAEHDSRRRRALVLRGHDGAGAMAVQMLVQRGWRVSVHAPFPFPPTSHHSADAGERYMVAVENRARSWGAEEVIFDDGELDGRGPIVRALDSLRVDGDAFDAVLDMVGGREIREAAERLLRCSSTSGMETPKTPGGFSLLDGKGSTKGKKKDKAMGQFTTLFGDVPERPIPTAGDHFRAGLRSLRFASSGPNELPRMGDEQEVPPTPSATGKGKVGYAWVSVAQDVDWEGEDVRDSISAVLRMALDGGVRPWVGPTPSLLMSTEDDADDARVVAFEKAPEVFVDGGPLCDGATVVVRVAAV